MAVASAMVLSLSACTDEPTDTGTVVSITDGDTLVASVGGKDQTIRLLNIDTPETKDPNEPVECLGAEATNFLRGLLPVGSKITLQYDVDRKDKYDRTLAAVFTPTDTFASADIARAGFGTAVAFGNNKKFLPPVQDAEKEAKASSRGIFDSSVECTLPGQLATVGDSLETAAAATAGSTAATTGTTITEVAAAIATAKTLQNLLQDGKTSTNVVAWSAYDESGLAAQIESLSTRIGTTESTLSALKKTKNSLTLTEAKAAVKKWAAETKAKADAALAKAAAEAKTKAAEKAQAAAKKAEADAAEADAAEAERIRNLPPVHVPPAPAPYVPPAPAPAPYVPPAPAPYVPPAQDNGGGYPGYNGPRCYAPGGKTWRPC
ncbi:thermonuclease family protein [Arthrobacter sp. H35-D1]|uniref:thermonuclease family protein n=1 Tax=Arthrobacter sp. H35-D1 TaxID=3046202 RepID=UPI0024BB0AC9|nr:thermonuclease family protein [Arthrobacter sp. H35-D1]MDJ0312575.1 thermonuclease family protein [Arthrobacter sp. H35-D1]